MPCVGPSPEEDRALEANRNLVEIGQAWDDQQAAINVACALWHHITKGFAIPDWASKWGARHDRQDRARQAREKREAEAERQRDLSEAANLMRKHGVKKLTAGQR